MKEIEQIDKTTQELNEAEKQILDEHTKKTANQLSHYLSLKKQKLYLKKKYKHNQIDEIKQELKNEPKL